MEIVLYPDPVLRRRAAEIPAFTPELEAKARAMFDLMYQAKGVGLAAPQVGDSVQMLVGNPTGDPAHPEQEFVLVNPRILRKKGGEFGEEGCLSFPGIYAEVERSRNVVVSCLDRSGQVVERSFEAFAARIVQHEMDHLTGTLFIDRMTPSDRIRASTRLKEMEERSRKSP